MRKNTTNYFFFVVVFLCAAFTIFSTNFLIPQAYGQFTLTAPEEKKAKLLDSAIFKENEQSSILVTPTYNNNSTNIAFYMKCPSESCPDDGTIESPVFIFSAENLGHGNKPFSEYWAPPIVNDYVAVEYINDSQQFSCSAITLDECLTDPHFVSVFYFTLTDNATIITEDKLVANALLNSSHEIAATSTASDALLQLSLSLSSTSISSTLDNGLIVTASLDGIASIATSSLLLDINTTISVAVETNESTSTETGDETPVGSFIMDIVGIVVEIFTLEETAPTEPKLVESIQVESISNGTTSTETNRPPIVIENIVSKPAPENEVRSSVPTAEVIENEIITTEF